MQLHKIEIARRQLEVASEIQISGGDFLAVITLAGAAEEILGSIVRRNGGVSMVDHLKEFDRNEFGGREHSIFNSEINGCRNALKHANHERDDIIEIEEGEAIAMLGRALVNWMKIGGEFSENMLLVYKELIIVAQSNES